MSQGLGVVGAGAAVVLVAFAGAFWTSGRS